MRANFLTLVLSELGGNDEAKGLTWIEVNPAVRQFVFLTVHYGLKMSVHSCELCFQAGPQSRVCSVSDISSEIWGARQERGDREEFRRKFAVDWSHELHLVIRLDEQRSGPRRNAVKFIRHRQVILLTYRTRVVGAVSC